MMKVFIILSLYRWLKSFIVHYAVCMQDELDLPEVGDFFSGNVKTLRVAQLLGLGGFVFRP